MPPQALANVLVVPPESLVGLVNATLKMDHRDALRFIRLRADFGTARVDGRSLEVGGVAEMERCDVTEDGMAASDHVIVMGAAWVGCAYRAPSCC